MNRDSSASAGIKAIDPARFIRDSLRAELVEAQPFDGAQGERDSWLIRAGSIDERGDVFGKNWSCP
jgi:hypothetical protein